MSFQKVYNHYLSVFNFLPREKKKCPLASIVSPVLNTIQNKLINILILPDIIAVLFCSSIILSMMHDALSLKVLVYCMMDESFSRFIGLLKFYNDDDDDDLNTS